MSLLLINIIAWIIIQTGISVLAGKRTLDFMRNFQWIYKERKWEKEGRLYERLLIKKWKDKVPEAARLLNIKNSRAGGRKEKLNLYIDRTKRSEYAHWLQIPPALLFFLWNDAVIAVYMILYALIFNLPFIMIQRYNRIRFSRAVKKLNNREGGC
ncbi:hypothetical protein GJU40_08920 [Bacillus lacus]|uniref:Glycosyl-4,4'-diaponeurosporenoate acyltransferase n=1 Tax=Metabacillus lacus TaxID=1983721 RepID=A0A7X2IYR9_9BACI|nr:hypothetical protein [Metabacillus lacus]MRX72272.1 hypothetical protein [Metabacillus lacus]